MKKEYIYAGASIFLWSTTATVSKLLLGSLNSLQVLTATTFFAFLTLLVLNIFKGNLSVLKRYTPKDFFDTAYIGFLGIFLYNVFLYTGISSMDASQAFIINYLWPLMTVIFACIILKEKMTSRKTIAILLSFIGVIIVTTNGNLFSIQKSSLMGAVYCILAAVSYGLYSVLNKQKSYIKSVCTMLYFLVSFLICLLYLFLSGKLYIPTFPQLAGFLWIGIGSNAIGTTTWALALEHGDTSKISNLAYITPFLSLIWTTLILKEDISLFSIVGLFVIISGIFIQLKDKKTSHTEK